ncbi:Extracellular signal-regulated kinase 1 [Diplonema papillatum]|nr:Extracellular signal-regulated kinase 1 [Diplonema papillatum]
MPASKRGRTASPAARKRSRAASSVSASSCGLSCSPAPTVCSRLSPAEMSCDSMPSGGPRRDSNPLARKLKRHTVLNGQDGYFFSAPHEYSNLKYLGKGTFGVVATASMKKEEVVIKRLHCNSLAYAESALRELWNLMFFTLNRDDDCGVVRMKDCWTGGAENEYVYLVLEKFSCSLDHYADEDNKLKKSDWRRVAEQVVHALHSFHSIGAFHRDLKPDNIVANDDLTRLAIIDLGSVRASCDMDQKRALTPAYQVTTEGFRAPEVVHSDRKYHEQMDVFSTGCLLAALRLGRELFYSNDDLEVFSNLSERDAKAFLETELKSMSKADRAFLMQMLERDPRKRATAEDLADSFATSPKEEPMFPATPYREPDYDGADMGSMFSTIQDIIFDFHAHANC